MPKSMLLCVGLFIIATLLTPANPFEAQNMPRGKPGVSFVEKLLTTIPENFDKPQYGGWAVQFSPDGSRAVKATTTGANAVGAPRPLQQAPNRFAQDPAYLL